MLRGIRNGPPFMFPNQNDVLNIYIYSTYRIIITDPTRLCVVGIEEYSMHQLRGTSRPWPGSKRPSQNSTTDIPS